MIGVLLCMVASLILIFVGLVTEVTIRTQGTSPLVHTVLTYAGLLVTLLSHMIAVMYIMGLRKLFLAEPPEAYGDDEERPEEVS